MFSGQFQNSKSKLGMGNTIIHNLQDQTPENNSISALALRKTNLVNFSNEIKTDSQSWGSEHGKKPKEQGIKQLMIKIKKGKICDSFLQKATRILETDDQNMLKFWAEQQKTSMPSRQGWVYPEPFEHLLEVLNIFCFPLLMIVTSFIGFLDEFAENYSNDPITISIKIFCLLVIIMRLVIKSTSKTFSDGEFKNYISQIIIAYFKTTRLLFDFIMIILQVLNLCFPSNMVIAGILFFYLNLMVVYLGNDTIRTEATYIQSRRTTLIWALLKIIFFNIFFAHFMATLLLGMAKLEPERSWMVRASIQNQTWYIKYINAYYWSTTIMMTVGFGDMLPGQGNWKEIFITSFVQLFSCIVLGYNVSSIGNILSKIRDTDQKVSRKMVVFERMIRRDRNRKVFINPFLQKRISNYLHQLRTDKSNLFYIQKDQLLSQLPQNLRRAYFKQANKRIFSKVEFFRYLKPKSLELLAQKFRSKSLNVGEALPFEDSILILEDGKVGLTYQKRGSTKNGKVEQEIESNEYDQTVLLNCNLFLDFTETIKYGMVSKSESIIWLLTKRQFFQVLRKSNIDLQYYFNLLHKHSILINEWEFIKCVRCSHEGKYTAFHSIFNCAKVTYMPIRSLSVSNYLSQHKSKSHDRLTCYQRYKRTLAKKNIYEWHMQFNNNYQKLQKSFNISINKSNRIPSIHRNILQTERNIKSSKIIKYNPDYIEEQEALQLKLRRIIKQVLFQHETGYEIGFWDIEADAAHDYHFYFPQDNCNRLQHFPINSHPRQVGKDHMENLTTKIKSISHMHASR